MTVHREVAADRDRCLVTVCRGCCCGDRGRHPDVDHSSQLDRLIVSLRGVADVRTSGCLLVCGESNVVVVAPAPAVRARLHTKPVWLGRVLDESLVDQIAGWVKSGGPGLAPMPSALASCLCAPFALDAPKARA